MKGGLLVPMILVLLANAAGADSRIAAFRAQAWLGAAVPSRVIRIENHPVGPSHYPAEFHALVFAFADVLWIYDQFDGTQNLSVRRGQVAADEANLGFLLRQLEPGLTAFTQVPGAPPAAARRPSLPPVNGCFPICVARWQELQSGRNPPARGRLIACFPKNRTNGHLLLEYWQDDRRYVFDPDRPAQLQRVAPAFSEDPLAVATLAVESRWLVKPIRATVVPLPEATHSGPAAIAAAASPPAAPRGGSG